MKNDLSKSDSLVIKGFAILLLLWHHCFLAGRYPVGQLSFLPFTESQVSNIAYFFKICVSIFAFISGFGLYKSFLSVKAASSQQSVSKWYLTRYVKSFSGYWFIVILAWLITHMISQKPAEVYFQGNSIIQGLSYMLLQLLGLTNLFGTPTLQWEWWYMSAALAFIILTPLLCFGLDRIGCLGCIGIVILFPRCFGQYPGGMHFLSFVPAFLMGMVFAKAELFRRLDQLVSSSKKQYILVVLILFVICFLCYKITNHLPREQFWDIELGIFPSFYIIFIFLTVARIPGLNRVLGFLGKHSANIYLTHEFFRNVYCTEFVYGHGSFLLSILRLLICSLLCSLVIEGLKRITFYNNLISRFLLQLERNYY